MHRPKRRFAHRRLVPSLSVCLLVLACTGPIASAQTGAQSNLPSSDELSVDALDGVHYSVVFRSTLSPFSEVQYELRSRGRTLLVSLTKTLVGGYGELQDVGLIPLEELTHIVADLSQCGVETLAYQSLDEMPTDFGHDTLEIDIQLGSFERAERFESSQLTLADSAWCTAQVLVNLYYRFADPIVFRNLFYDEGEFGQLSTTSIPPAHLYIDGLDTMLETPVQDLPLETGMHTLRYVNTELGIDRQYSCTIMEGMTTRVDPELR